MDRKELIRIIAEAAEKGSVQLDLSNRGITELPPEIGKLTSLKRLNLAGNQLTSLLPGISQLVSLQELCLGATVRKGLVLVVHGTLTNVQGFMRRNHLTSLPPDIAELRNLRKLYLDDNQLTSLPPEIGLLTRLRVLDLRNNRLHQLPESILELSLDFNTKELQDEPGISGVMR